MPASLEAWFNTRPVSPVSEPPPLAPSTVVLAAMSTAGDAEVRIVRRGDGLYTFEIVAWTNFCDAGGNPHHQWHTFQSPTGFLSDSLETAIDEAVRDAQNRRLPISEFA